MTPEKPSNDEAARDVGIKERRARDVRKAAALQDAILNCTGFSAVVTDERGVIQMFNAGAAQRLGYTAAEVVNRLTPADLCDPSEVTERARTLSLEFGTAVAPGFEAMVFKASRGIDDQYELSCVRKDGSRLPLLVFVAALHERKGQVAGYLLIATDNTARRQIEEPERRAEAFPPMSAAAPAPRCRLLYVEDHPESVDLVEQLMARRTDVLLLCAADMDLGIELARAERPEVILMNVDLPGIGAIPFMRLLRADPATRNTPILALSANAARDAVAKGLEAGFFHYLAKPMKAAPFMEALDDALEFVALERAEENTLPSRAAHGH
jgi:CheY-like chemotaxis protein